MTDDDLAALAAEIKRLGWRVVASDMNGEVEVIARAILESEWLREHDARVRREGAAAFAEWVHGDRPGEGDAG